MNIYREFCKEKFDYQGRLIEFELKYNESFNFGYDVVDRIAESEPDKQAIVWCNSEGHEKKISFDELRVLSCRAANLFKAYGIKKGDRVMTILKRRFEYWYVAIALHKIGAILVPVTHMLTEEDMKYRIDTAEIKAVISVPDADILKRLYKVKKDCDDFESVFVVNAGEIIQNNKLNRNIFIDFSDEMKKFGKTLKRETMKAKDPMVIYFTSGTTGQPKGVMHDNTYPLSHIVTAKYWQGAEDDGLHFSIAETGWAKTAWGKMYGQWLVGSAVMIYDFDVFDPKQIENIINKYKVTTFCAPPTIYKYMVMKKVSEMKSLKRAATAGESLSQSVFNDFEKLTGLHIIEGYGQTETALLLADFDSDSSKIGSLGKPSPMFDIRLMDSKGNYVSDGEVGEIVIHVNSKKNKNGIFFGYYDDRLRYEYAWRKGVFHTGDVAVSDEDGYFWFKGRMDDVIKTGGYRVGPFEIENVLNEHPGVLECSVVGVEDKTRGQAIKALVVLNKGFSASGELGRELKDFCNSRLAEYKWVRIIEFVDELSKTSNGKIRRM